MALVANESEDLVEAAPVGARARLASTVMERGRKMSKIELVTDVELEACRRLRKVVGMTQARLAVHAGIARTDLCLWENGTRRLRPDQLSRIAGVLLPALEARRTEINTLAEALGREAW
jgi:DNA-binding XRE family transcriptional regulator